MVDLVVIDIRLGVLVAVLQQLPEGAKEGEPNQHTHDPRERGRPFAEEEQGNNQGPVEQQPANQCPGLARWLLRRLFLLGQLRPSTKHHLEGGDTCQRLEEESQVERLIVGYLGVIGGPQEAMMVPVDRSVVLHIDANETADEDVVEQIVAVPIPMKIEMCACCREGGCHALDRPHNHIPRP